MNTFWFNFYVSSSNKHMQNGHKKWFNQCFKRVNDVTVTWGKKHKSQMFISLHDLTVLSIWSHVSTWQQTQPTIPNLTWIIQINKIVAVSLKYFFGLRPARDGLSQLGGIWVALLNRLPCFCQKWPPFCSKVLRYGLPLKDGHDVTGLDGDDNSVKVTMSMMSSWSSC